MFIPLLPKAPLVYGADSISLTSGNCRRQWQLNSHGVNVVEECVNQQLNHRSRAMSRRLQRPLCSTDRWLSLSRLDSSSCRNPVPSACDAMVNAGQTFARIVIRWSTFSSSSMAEVTRFGDSLPFGCCVLACQHGRGSVKNKVCKLRLPFREA